MYNTTNGDIDIGGLIITDDDSYPFLSGEDKLIVPAGMTILAGGLVILRYNPVSDITGEIVCTKSGSFAFK